MCIVAPVCGLRPERAARLLTKKLPNPVMETLSPLANALEIAPVVADRARAASALVKPEPSAIAATKSDLFIFLSLVFLNLCKSY
jgi:putative acetyltransferase